MKKMLAACILMCSLCMAATPAWCEATRQRNVADFYQLFTKRLIEYSNQYEAGINLTINNHGAGSGNILLINGDNVDLVVDTLTLGVKRAEILFYEMYGRKGSISDQMHVATAAVSALEFGTRDSIFGEATPDTAMDDAILLVCGPIAGTEEVDFDYIYNNPGKEVHTYSGNYDYSICYVTYEKNKLVTYSYVRIIAMARDE